MVVNESKVKELPTTTPATMVNDIMPLAVETPYPIAVVDTERQLNGIVTKASVLHPCYKGRLYIVFSSAKYALDIRQNLNFIFMKNSSAYHCL